MRYYLYVTNIDYQLLTIVFFIINGSFTKISIFIKFVLIAFDYI